MPTNRAAWATAKNAKPLLVQAAPYPTPEPNEIVIKNVAIAINPVDGKLQEWPMYPLSFPTILGQDVAGEVVEVGSAVTRFRKGDRVLGYTCNQGTKHSRDGGFQEYTPLASHMASPIPSDLSFEKAAVLPLGCAAAGAALFQKGHLGFQYPSLNPKPTGKTLLVWGGATSVGANLIQLAIAAGYEVITTASAKNFNYIRRLGAIHVVDYHSPTVVSDLVAAFNGRILAGAVDTISVDDAIQNTLTVVDRVDGNKVVISVSKIPKEIPKGIIAKPVFAHDIKDNEVGKLIYEDFLPQALAEGKYIPAPEPYVTGKGLEAIQDGLEIRKTVSARKAVVTL